MRNLLFIISFLLVSVMTGCSSDDSEDDVASIDVGNVNASGTFSFEDDSVAVNFYLTDSKGERRSVFSYGENIVFNLSISNKTEKHFLVKNGITHLLGYDIFRVYDANGRDMGIPWYYEDIYAIIVYLYPKTTSTYSCSWMKSDDAVCKYPFNLLGRKALPPGKYYSIFNFHLYDQVYGQDDKELICGISFEVTSKFKF